MTEPKHSGPIVYVVYNIRLYGYVENNNRSPRAVCPDFFRKNVRDIAQNAREKAPA